MTTELDTLAADFDWQSDALAWPVTTDVGAGLAGVVACTTRVVWLDPTSGLLAYRGVPIEDLALGSDFEEVAHLLITGTRAEDDPGSFREFRSRLRASRILPTEVIALLADMDPTTHPTRMLRAGMAALGCHELGMDDDLAGASHWRELRILGQTVGVASTVTQLRRGLTPTASGDETSLAEGLLMAMLGREPAPHEVRTLDLAWVMYAAHGLDAPTFTSMIVASCLADPYANIVAGLSALRGDRYGGAAERVVEQLERLDTPDDARRWVEATLARGDRIAGFGHRTLAMPDPRVVILRKAYASLARRCHLSRRFSVVRAVESEATRRLASRGVHVNVNLYGAALFHTLGADAAEVPVLVAVARTAGMVAFVHEALATIRLFRPLSRYVGAAPRHVPYHEAGA